MRKLFALLFLIPSISVLSQEKEGDIYFQIGTSDAELYLKNYLSPLFNGIGYGFNSGWYNTAATHDRWGFDFTISANVAFIPRKDLTFTFNNSQFDHLKVSSGNSAELSTIFGPENKADRPELTIIDDNGEELVRATSFPGAINMKDAVGFSAVPMPMYQFGLGIIKNTDLKLRILPKISFDDASVSMIGFGLQHDLGQWFKELQWQNISIAVFAGYNQLTMKYGLNYDAPATEENEGILNLSGFNLQALASKEYYKIITLYGGIGYSRAGSRVRLTGTYPAGDINYQLPEDPIDFKYGDNSANVTFGITLKLVIVTVGVSHCIQNYHVTNASVGLTIR